MKIPLLKKLSFFIIASVILFTGLTVYSIYYITKGEIETIKKDNLLSLNNGYVNEMLAYIENYEKDIDLIADHKNILPYLLSEDKDSQNEEILNDFNHHNLKNDFLAIYLMDLDGYTWVSTDDNFVGNNYGFRNYFKEAVSHGSGIFDISRGVTSGQVGYYYSVPILDAEGFVHGVLVGKLDPYMIYRPIANKSLDKDNDVMFVDDFGVIVYANEPDKIYKSLGQLNDTEKQAIEATRRFEGIKIEPLHYEQAQDFVRGSTNFALLDSINDTYDNRNEVLSIMRLGDLPFSLILEEDSGSFSAIAIRIAETLGVVVVLSSFFMLLIMYIFIGKVLKPLKILEEGIEKIWHGDLSHRTNIKTGDELEDIGEGFNNMAEELEKNIKDIEKKVLERTEILERLNKYMIGRELKMVDLKRKIKDNNEA